MSKYIKNINNIMRNPFSLWLSFVLGKIRLQIKYRNKHLHIGYMSRAIKCEFGHFNTIYDYVTLIETKIGDFTYVNNGSILCRATIGRFCSIGNNVMIGLGKHPSKRFISTHPAFYAKDKWPQRTFAESDYFMETGNVTIGSDVWVGNGAYVLDDVVIGHGAIIGAGAVVTKDVAPYNIVAGIPAKLIRLRFNNEEIDALLSYRWWEKDIDWFAENYMLFHEVSNFVKLIKSGKL